MKRRQKVNFVAIGIFIFLGIVLFGVGIYFAGQYIYVLRGDYKLKIVYDYLDDLSKGSSVRIGGGKTIGYVNAISMYGGRQVVEVIIDHNFKINRSASFHIYSTSIVGMKYIDVEGYDPSENVFFQPDETVYGVSPLGMSRVMEMLGMIGNMLMEGNNPETVGKVKTAFGDTIQILGSLSALIEENRSNIKRTVDSMASTMESADELMGHLSATLSNLESISASLDNSMDERQLKEIVKNVNLLSGQLNTLLANLNSPEGTLSLLNDPAFRHSLENTIKNLESFSEQVKDRPNSIIFGQ